MLPKLCTCRDKERIAMSAVNQFATLPNMILSDSSTIVLYMHYKSASEAGEGEGSLGNFL